jgi:hypothetical protein
MKESCSEIKVEEQKKRIKEVKEKQRYLLGLPLYV